MAYKFTEKKDNRQQQTTYALYMIISSYFHKSICNNKRLETNLHLYYQDLPTKKQEDLEEKLISDIENKLKDTLPVLEEMNCTASIRQYQGEYHLAFETGFETISVIVDKKGHYQFLKSGEANRILQATA